MNYTTYENYNNPHVTIHRGYCHQIRQRGGIHTSGDGKYTQHATYQYAFSYAQTTGLPIKNCYFCNPTEHDSDIL